MNSSEIKTYLFKEIDSLPENALLELQTLITSFVSRIKNTSKTAKIHKKRSFGSMKGSVTYMSADFNAPMSEFNDYM